MAKRIINTGTLANPTGDSLKNAFTKVNDNFTELYNALGLDGGGLNIGAFEFSGSTNGIATISTTDSSSIKIDQSVEITSNLNIGMELYASNLKRVTSSAGLKQVFFDPTTGELVVLNT